jgi:hypothetical protein
MEGRLFNYTGVVRNAAGAAIRGGRGEKTVKSIQYHPGLSSGIVFRRVRRVSPRPLRSLYASQISEMSIETACSPPTPYCLPYTYKNLLLFLHQVFRRLPYLREEGRGHISDYQSPYAEHQG